jgi:hypothetical protein
VRPACFCCFKRGHASVFRRSSEVCICELAHISRSLIGQGDRFRMWPLTLFLYGSIILIVALIFGVALLVYAVTRGDDDNDEGWK